MEGFGSSAAPKLPRRTTFLNKRLVSRAFGKAEDRYFLRLAGWWSFLDARVERPLPRSD
jgi:hypothetical protein